MMSIFRLFLNVCFVFNHRTGVLCQHLYPQPFQNVILQDERVLLACRVTSCGLSSCGCHSGVTSHPRRLKGHSPFYASCNSVFLSSSEGSFMGRRTHSESSNRAVGARAQGFGVVVTLFSLWLSAFPWWSRALAAGALVLAETSRPPPAITMAHVRMDLCTHAVQRGWSCFADLRRERGSASVW